MGGQFRIAHSSKRNCEWLKEERPPKGWENGPTLKIEGKKKRKKIATNHGKPARCQNPGGVGDTWGKGALRVIGLVSILRTTYRKTGIRQC